jgi:hypothetical protein
MKTRIGLLLVIMLTACASAAPAISPATASPTAARTGTPTIPAPTRTVHYPFDFTVPWTPTVPTPDRTLLATYQSDSDRQATQVAANLAAADWICGTDGYFPGLPTEVSNSPDKHWIVITCRTGDKLVTRVARSDRSAVWQIPWDRYFPSIKDANDGALFPVHWSKDGRTVFLEPHTCCYDWFSNEAVYYPVTELYTLDLFNGDFKSLLGGTSSYSIAFSPNDHYLIYSRHGQAGRADLLELATGVDRILRLSDRYVDIGIFTWTPDGQHVLLSAALDGWLEGQAGISLYRLDIGDRSLNPLLVDDRRQFVPEFYSSSQPWLDRDTLLLRSFVDNSQAAIDIRTGLLQILPTPTL